MTQHHPPGPKVFTSLGMFVMDEIHYPDRPSEYDVLGGGGLFALLGSRIVLSFNDTTRTTFFLDEGADFPQAAEDTVGSWNTGVIIRRDPQRLTTRGWNRYYDANLRAFRYVTPKKRIDIEDLLEHDLTNSRSLHFICSLARCTEMARKWEALQRASLEDASVSPVVCWEPIPDTCAPENLPACCAVLSRIDVFTPNAEEAARFFGEPEPTSHAALEQLAERFVPYLAKVTLGLGAAVVLRCGPLGLYIRSSKGYKKWFPAYQSVNPKPQVVDCTGAGNTTCAAFTTALVLSRDWDVAGICGNVASGICIEQLGLPAVENVSVWNGLDLRTRIANYLQWSSSSEYTVDEVLCRLSGKN